jgi:hypothetical protein
LRGVDFEILTSGRRDKTLRQERENKETGIDCHPAGIGRYGELVHQTNPG